MSIDHERRRCLKTIAAVSALPVLPMQFAFGSDSDSVYVITNSESFDKSFITTVNKLNNANTLLISNRSYDSLSELAFLPKGSVLIGLVNEAEKVLIEAIIHDRRGRFHAVDRVNKPFMSDEISELAISTTELALTRSSHQKELKPVTKLQKNDGGLISFYAHL